MPSHQSPSVARVAAAGRLALACALLPFVAGICRADAQQPAGTITLTRDSSVSIALAHGYRAALAGATARSASARVREASAFGNPLLSATYSKAVPQYHAVIDLPLDFVTMRGPRLAAARSASAAAQLRLAYERAAIRLDVDTSYTIAAASHARAALSLRNAVDAESLLVIAGVRRNAGDASDLDVDVARINAGRARNLALADSMTAVAALLALQQALGLSTAEPAIALADTLAVPGADSVGAAGVTLPVAAAQRDLQQAEQTLTLERRSIWSGLALQAGIENHDPTGTETGILPTFGLSVPLPLFNQRQGSIAVAAAERDRAKVELAVAQRESAALISRARRDLAAARARVARDRELVATADRVARLSLRAYAEGSYPLTTVLEAERNARDSLVELIDDLVAANTAAAALRLYAGTTIP